MTMTKKEIFYSNKIILFIKIAIIQILYLIFGYALIGGGHGTYTQFFAFYSILLVPIIININFPIISSDYINFYLIAVVILFFIISIILTYSLINKIINKKLLLIIFWLHNLMGIFLIIVIEIFNLNLLSSDFKIKIIGYCIGLVLNFYFWIILFKIRVKT